MTIPFSVRSSRLVAAVSDGLAMAFDVRVSGERGDVHLETLLLCARAPLGGNVPRVSARSRVCECEPTVSSAPVTWVTV